MTQEYAALTQCRVLKCQHETCVEAVDQVAEEVPVALVYNDTSHVVMMATPQHLHEYALGFSMSEGILQHASEMQACTVTRVDEGIQIDMRIPEARHALLEQQKRNLAGRTACGLCGMATLQQLTRHLPQVNSSARFSARQIHDGFTQMQQQQVIQQQTGAAHAAGWLDAQGNVVQVREDVGRHNALDKLIGALLLSGQDVSDGAVLLTSRASFEMVQKTAALGIGVLAAISAPTGRAIHLAQQTGVTLLGFVRTNSHVIYSHPQRIIK